jgi:hypothetical protein
MRAESPFVEDIAPELHRKGELSLWKKLPGCLVFCLVEEAGMFVTRNTPLRPRRMLGCPLVRVESNLSFSVQE